MATPQQASQATDSATERSHRDSEAHSPLSVHPALPPSQRLHGRGEKGVGVGWGGGSVGKALSHKYKDSGGF